MYQKAQQWSELAALLAAPAPAPRRAPPWRAICVAEAAEIFENKLERQRAREELYQNVLAEDPTHLAAGEGLQRILEETRDLPAW